MSQKPSQQFSTCGGGGHALSYICQYIVCLHSQMGTRGSVVCSQHTAVNLAPDFSPSVCALVWTIKIYSTGCCQHVLYLQHYCFQLKTTHTVGSTFVCHPLQPFVITGIRESIVLLKKKLKPNCCWTCLLQPLD